MLQGDNSLKYFAELQKFPDETEEKSYQSLKSSYWISVCTWISQNVDKIPATDESKRKIMRLFFDVDDITVKTEILLRLKRLFNTKDDYRRFLVNVIIRSPNDAQSVRAAMQVAATVIESDEFLYKTILSYVSSSSSVLQTSLLARLIRSRYFISHISRIRSLMPSKSDYPTRVLFLRRINALHRYTSDGNLQIRGGRYIDYEQKIGLRELREILTRKLESFGSDEVVQKRKEFGGVEQDEMWKNITKEEAKKLLFEFGRFELSNLSLLDNKYSADQLAEYTMRAD